MIETEKTDQYIETEMQKILKERMPSPDEVIYKPTIEFFDVEEELTREERGMVIAMGDRTAKSYCNLKQMVIEDRGKPPVEFEGESMDRTSAFYLQYTLGAGSSKRISHSSILEQLSVGLDKSGGDPPIIFEGVSVLSSLRDICSLRHFGFESFSSRGGIYPAGYWRIPKELVDAGLGDRLNAINERVYQAYLELTEAGIKHYLRVLKKDEGEKNWQFRWRVLNHALDDARQVTNGSFLNHFSMHPNNALALREAIVKLASSELPETRELADKLRELARQGLPTLMRYTEASPYVQSLPARRADLRRYMWWGDRDFQRGQIQKSRLLDVSVTPDAEKIFLAAFVANTNDIPFNRALAGIRETSEDDVNRLVDLVFTDMGFHDKPPQELEMIQVRADFLMSVGAIYEMIRHRLATHIVGEFTINYGFTMPDIYRELGLESVYLNAIHLNETALDLVVRKLGWKSERVFGSYFVTRAHLVPITVRMGGSDVFHILKLRASPSAHPDIREPMHALENILRNSGVPMFRHLVTRAV